MDNSNYPIIHANIHIVDNYLLSNYGIGSESNIFQSLALTLIMIEQCVLLFTPWFFKLLSIVLLLLLPGKKIFVDDEPLNNLSKYGSNKKIINEPIVFNDYRNFIDDRKAKTGSISDIQKLKSNGFNKYRYLSKKFMKCYLLNDEEAFSYGSTKKLQKKNAN